ncbi:MAG: glycerate kinase [Oscillospiraceae bacterium]|nr:glycerate kinase [Oscillospiraceae bacterium]
MKKCIIASDSFKGTLSSSEICDIARRVIKDVFPDCSVMTIPVADGGEGTVECFERAAGAVPVRVTVSGPLGEPMEAEYAVMGKTAVIELASAAGLPLIEDRKSPLRATTFGVGQLMRHAAENGCTSILLGLGGSATTDSGCGMAAALDAVFLDKEERSFVPTGGTLEQVTDIDISGTERLLRDVSLTVMCDVNNPLYGETGAAHVYGPQKGADPDTVELLDRGLRHISDVITEKLGKDISAVPGAGAAGGSGAGCMAFLGGRLVSGTEAVLDAVGFDEALKDADIVITGEGKLDSQSLNGKLLYGVSSRTRRAGVPLIAIVGTIAGDAGELYEKGLAAVFQTNRAGLPFSDIPPRAASDYEATLRDVMNLIKATEKKG